MHTYGRRHPHDATREAVEARARPCTVQLQGGVAVSRPPLGGAKSYEILITSRHDATYARTHM